VSVGGGEITGAIGEFDESVLLSCAVSASGEPNPGDRFEAELSTGGRYCENEELGEGKDMRQKRGAA
jgi:hypothetical protein